MTPTQVIKHFGGVHATARALGIRQPSVSEWRRNKKVPYFRQLDIEKLTKYKLKAETR
jgi:DNA-binding transcriptional regulator YdaS (Cro superfamily)